MSPRLSFSILRIRDRKTVQVPFPDTLSNFSVSEILRLEKRGTDTGRSKQVLISRSTPNLARSWLKTQSATFFNFHTLISSGLNWKRQTHEFLESSVILCGMFNFVLGGRFHMENHVIAPIQVPAEMGTASLAFPAEPQYKHVGRTAKT